MNTEPLTAERVLATVRKVQEWVESRDYRGYEPFDGLSSWLRPLALGRELPQRLLQQFVKLCPVNVRPLLGVSPKDSTKGRGYMASGHLLLHRAGLGQNDLEKAVASLRWLDGHRVARFPNHSWSNHYDFVGRGGEYTSNDPIIVWTSLIGHAYVEAFEATGSAWFLDVARSACDWIMALPRERTASGNCLSYFADRQASVHNANMLGAGCLARTARHCGREDYVRVARSAMEYSCGRQRPDGSWWYGEEDKYRWIDNFHTGYNLDSLKHYIDATQDEAFRPHLDKGLGYFAATFFEADGCPRYYHDRTYPVDIQCAAQAIDTLASFGLERPDCLELARRVATWTLDNMWDGRRGTFHFRKYPFVTVRTAMLHWGQATMFKALSQLYVALRAQRAAAA
jgi:hypothetical protein